MNRLRRLVPASFLVAIAVAIGVVGVEREPTLQAMSSLKPPPMRMAARELLASPDAPIPPLPPPPPPPADPLGAMP